MSVFLGVCVSRERGGVRSWGLTFGSGQSSVSEWTFIQNNDTISAIRMNNLAMSELVS